MNKELNYTKGEWNVLLAQSHYEHKFEISYDLLSGETYPIADIHDVEIGEAEANAQLISAAPDLYEALKAIMGYFDSSEIENASQYFPLMRNALAKAEQK